jgi:multidrug resistance protein MdtO
MAAGNEALPRVAQLAAIDKAGVWFWNFLKAELAPYPGRAWTVGRITIAATITMILVMTFRVPTGFLGVIYALFLTRENPTASMRAGVRVLIAFFIATAYSIVGIMMLLDDPLTHFLWIVISLFISFYLIRIIPDYGTAVGFGFMIGGAIPLWDQTNLTVNDRVENTLWTSYVVLIGLAVTIGVEYVFRRVHPTTDLTEGMQNRLRVVADVLRNLAAGLPPDHKLNNDIALYSNVGTSRLRRLLLRSGYSSHFIAQVNTAVALLGRLVDLAASLRAFSLARPVSLTPEDRERCLHLADQLSQMQVNLLQRQLIAIQGLSIEERRSNLPFLPVMERTAALLPQAFSGTPSLSDVFIPAPMDEEIRQRLFLPDALTNPAHLQFALRGTLAATAAYVIYTSIDWRGLSTAIVTCIITALSTIGSSRQKQFLRIAGVIVGGIIIGMGAQVFVLPYIDSITGFTLLFAIVTAISGWISTATPRLSYLGVQLALAFYVINVQEFTIQTSLAVARDRVFGVLLGLMCMWLFYDRLWTRNALDEMQKAFAGNFKLFAELTEQLLKDDRNEAVKRFRQLRDQINAGFDTVRAQADAVIFEFGPARARKLKIRDDIRKWQPSVRALMQVQVTFAQYRLQKPLSEVPNTVADAHVAFERDTALLANVMAAEVSGEMTGPVPDLRASADRLQQELRNCYAARGIPLPTQASDVITLSQTLASIMAPLYEDIHASLTNQDEAIRYVPQPSPGTA